MRHILYISSIKVLICSLYRESRTVINTSAKNKLNQRSYYKLTLKVLHSAFKKPTKFHTCLKKNTGFIFSCKFGFGIFRRYQYSLVATISPTSIILMKQKPLIQLKELTITRLKVTIPSADRLALIFCLTVSAFLRSGNEM